MVSVQERSKSAHQCDGHRLNSINRNQIAQKHNKTSLPSHIPTDAIGQGTSTGHKKQFYQGGESITIITLLDSFMAAFVSSTFSVSNACTRICGVCVCVCVCVCVGVSASDLALVPHSPLMNQSYMGERRLIPAWLSVSGSTLLPSFVFLFL